MSEASVDSVDTEYGDEQGPVDFSTMGLPSQIVRALRDMEFSRPTPVQHRCFDAVMEGRDVIVMAQTGTGKTAAFGIPLLAKIPQGTTSPVALVLVPTRELALQVSTELSRIAAHSNVTCTPVYGGAAFSAQVDAVAKGTAVIVGTPGRVLDHMRRGTISFAQIRHLVLDEADEMLSMGFEKELSAIMDGLPKDRQTLLFSATIPDDIERLSKRYMREPTVIRVSGDEVAAASIAHYVYMASPQGRLRDLIRIIEIEEPESAIVFCNTREDTNVVAQALRNAGYQAEPISSDLSQAEREKVMGKLRKGAIRFLVATDVAARGIDISHLTHVINYAFPEALENYIHRTGRTGRQGRDGCAISLVTPHDIGNLYMLRLTYKIFPQEKAFPSDEELAAQRAASQIDALRRRAAEHTPDAALWELAGRLMTSPDARQVVAWLLATVQDAAATGDKEGAGRSSGDSSASSRGKRRARRKASQQAASVAKPAPSGRPEPSVGPAPAAAAEAPAPGGGKETLAAPESKSTESRAPVDGPTPSRPEETAAASRDVAGDGAASGKEAASVSQPAAAVQPADWDAQGTFDPEDRAVEERVTAVRRAKKPDLSDPDGVTDIYIHAGRSDGLRIAQLMKEIVDKTQLPRTEIGKVRMLTRSTVISVPNRTCKKVMEAVRSISHNGVPLKAEYA